MSRTITIKCPICGEITKWGDNRWRPFCSERCKTTDLGEWASENYSIEGREDDDDTENNKEEEA